MPTHIGPNGPGDCGAGNGRCPYGGDSGRDDHFDTVEEATAVWEARMASANPPIGLKKVVSRPAPPSITDLQAQRSEIYKRLSAKMEEEFGPHWASRMDEPGVHHGYSRNSFEAEEIDRKIEALKFSPRNGEQTIATMEREASMIDGWLSENLGNWDDMVGEPEFDEYMDLYERMEELNSYLDSQKAR